MPLKYAIQPIVKFLQLESASSILLLLATVMALVMRNVPLFAGSYEVFLNVPINFHIGEFGFNKPLLLWINDGLMTLFFLVVGLELKREMLEGHLSQPSQVILPIIAAAGGMAVPSLIYTLFNFSNPATIHGWAIASATDIAFSLGVISVLGSRVPVSLKIFLMALAIIDDLGAIILIALFYAGHELHLIPLFIVVASLITLWLLNISRITNVVAYAIVGAILWLAMLKSGIHATLAGVLLAFFIPNISDDEGSKPLHWLEQALHPWVAYIIVPLFAFANAGVYLGGISLSTFWEPVPIGIMLGLFLGKQLGVFSFAWLTVKLGFAKLPAQATWLELYGVGILCGIGFTMSLFIGSLAFNDEMLMNEVRLGVLSGSLISAIVGYLLLFILTAKRKPLTEQEQVASMEGH